MFFIFFLGYWLILFYDQFRSSKRYNGRIDMKDYAFCSNLIISFPRWLIGVLFFNVRLTKLPLTIVVGQIANYGFLIFALIRQYVFHLDTYLYYPLLKIWVYSFTGLFLAMIVDHEIYYLRHKHWRL